MSDVTIDVRTARSRYMKLRGSVARDAGGNRRSDHDRRPAEARAPYLEDDDVFCLTYGDGVSNVDIGKLIAFHASTASSRP